MSEWIDFFVFATQAVILWVAMPRHSARFVRPMLFDRNPAWAAAHPDIVASLERGDWWFKSVQAWGIFSVLVLLTFRLGLQPDFLSPETMRTPSWEVLMTTSNVLMAFGFLLFGLGMVRGYRWLKRNVPLAATRQATLTPRSTDDFVPRWVQYLAYALLVANVLVRPAVELFYPGRLENVWGASAVALFMAVLMFVVAVIGVVRPPNHFDRAMGPAYRRLEVHVYFAIMFGVAIAGLLYTWLELNGVDVRRYTALVTGACVSAALVAFMRLPVAPPEGAQPSLTPG